MVGFKELKKNWLFKLQEKNFLARLFITLIFLVAVLYSLAKFLAYNETRPGVGFTDPLLSLFVPIDITWFTFILIYAALIVALISLSFDPENFIFALQSYSFVALFRLTTIYLLPLNAPETIIPLTDPFIEFFGGGKTLYKDLFFSGHTSTMFLFYLTNKNSLLRKIFLASTVLVGVCVLLQHVHYTVDVLAAPFFAYGSYKLAIVVNSFLTRK